MTEKERLEWIGEVAGAARILTRNPARSLMWFKEIYQMFECIQLMAAMPDAFIDSNAENFSTTLDVARKLIVEAEKWRDG